MGLFLEAVVTAISAAAKAMGDSGLPGSETVSLEIQAFAAAVGAAGTAMNSAAGGDDNARSAGSVAAEMVGFIAGAAAGTAAAPLVSAAVGGLGAAVATDAAIGYAAGAIVGNLLEPGASPGELGGAIAGAFLGAYYGAAYGAGLGPQGALVGALLGGLFGAGFGKAAVGAAEKIFEAASHLISPLVMDLTGAGVNLTALSATSPFFDLVGNGFARQTGWIGTGTGLLCVDRSGDGQINDISELFGQSGSFTDGFAALRALDTNGDGVIDSSDAAFSQLRVWVNPEQDGIVHPGELLTLTQLGIVSISLSATVTDQTIAGNTIKLTSTYTLADGTQRTIADAWFSNSPTYTRPDVATTISSDVAALPTLNGYGTMRDVQSTSMSDTTLKGELQAIVTTIGEDPGATLAAVKTMMLEWSGSTGIDPTGRGGIVDARQVDFLEKYLGVPFYGSYGSSDLRWRSAIDVREAWNGAFDGIVARVALQAGYTLPEFTYDSVLDFVLPTTSLQASMGSLYARLADLNATNASQWDIALRVADAFRMDARLSTAGYLAEIAADTSDTIAAEASTLISGLSMGGDGSGRFAIAGVTENSMIYAGLGVSLISIQGGDTGLATALNDSVVYQKGDGQLEINITDHSDTRADNLLFGAGITPSDVTVSLDQNGVLILQVGTGGDQVRVDGMFSSSVASRGSVWNLGFYYDTGITSIQFADGTTWQSDQIRTLVTTGSSGADLIYGTDAADVLDGKGAPSGSQDYERGNGGADTFVFNAGYGELEIDESGLSNGANTAAVLRLGAGITPGLVTLSSDSDGNVLLKDGVSGDLVKIDHALNLEPFHGNSAYGVATIAFADGTVWTRQQVIDSVTTGTSGSDSLFGSNGADTFDGEGAPAGYQDYEQGNGGADNFVYNAGYGHLEINEDAAFVSYNGSYNVSNAALQLGSGILATQVRITSDRYGNVFMTDGVTGDRVEIDAMINTSSQGNAEFGVAQVTFADGTTWTRRQVVAIATTGTVGADDLYGTSGAEYFDGMGGNDYEQGNGGADTFIYKPGYGQLEISEDAGYFADSVAKLQLALGIVATQVTVTPGSGGALILTDGTTGDSVQIDSIATLGLYGHSQFGVGSVVFADGTTWSRSQLLTYANGSDPGSPANVFVMRPGHVQATLGAGIDTIVFDRGGVQGTVVMNGGTATLVLGPSIAASDILMQANGAGDLTVTLRGDTTDSVTFRGALYHGGGGVGTRLTSMAFDDGSVQPLSGVLTFTWDGSATSASLAGSTWGNNTFEMAAGVQAAGVSAYTNTFKTAAGMGSITLGAAAQSNVITYNLGEGSISIVANGGSGTIQFGVGITAANVSFQADAGGDLTLLIGSSGDAIAVSADLSRNPLGDTTSSIQSLLFSDGTSETIAYSHFDQGHRLNFTWTGSTANAVLTGSTWGDNTFQMASGVSATGASAYVNTFVSVSGEGAITFGAGAQSNIVTYSNGDGSIAVNADAATGLIQLDSSITADNVSFQTDIAGDLTILDGTAGDSITVSADLFKNGNTNQINSYVGSLLLAGGQTISLNGLAFVWNGSADNTSLIGDGWGANTFNLAPGGDTVTFGKGQYSGSNPNTVNYAAGTGAATINLNGTTGTVNLGAGITAANLTYQADAVGDLTILDGTAGDSITINGDLFKNGNTNQINSYLGSLALAGGSTVSLNNLPFVWTGTASNTVLTGTGWGANTFNLAPGGDTVIFGKGQYSGSNPNTVNYAAGTGAATINLNGTTGTVNLGAGITAANLTYQADAVGDLTILDGTAGDSITINGDLFKNGNTNQINSVVPSLVLANGASVNLNSLAFVWTGTASNTVLTGSGWGANTFNLAPGGDTVIFGNGQYGGANLNTVYYNKGNGAAKITLNGGNGIIQLGAGITAANLTYQADAVGDLTILDGTAGDSITINGDLFKNGNTNQINSYLGSLALAGGSTVSLNNLPFVWTGTASNTVLTGTGWGANTFNLAPGGDTVIFGKGQYSGSNPNTVNYAAGTGAATINLNGTTGTVNLGAGITAANLTYQADAVGDLTILDGTAGDSITINGDLFKNGNTNQINSYLGSLALAGGSTVSLNNLPFVWTGTASNTVLTGTGWGANTFNLAPGGDTVIFGKGQYSGSNPNTVNYAAGTGAATINLNATTGTINLGGGITAAKLTFLADAAGDLTILDGTAGDSITIAGDLYKNPNNNNIYSTIGPITLADGTTVSLSGLPFVWNATSSNTTLTGSGWGANTFNLAVGGDTVTFGSGQYSGANPNTVNYAMGDGAATININGSSGTLRFATGITASQLAYSANSSTGDLLIAIGSTGDSILIKADLYNYYGNAYSRLAPLVFADNSTVSLNNLTFVSNGTSSNTNLIGAGWGANVFNLGAGGDVVTFGNAQYGGSNQNTVNYTAGNGAATINLNGGAGSIHFGSGITLGAITFQADAAGDLTILDGKPGESVTVKADIYNYYGNFNSRLGPLVFADGSTLTLNNPTFTWTGTSTITSLVGSSLGNNNFVLGPGIDAVTLGSSKNTFLFNSGAGPVGADVSSSSTSARSEVDFGPGIAKQNIWLSNQGGDLVAQLLGSNDALTIKHWFGTGVASEVATLRGADGLKLDSQFGALVSAMASYQSNNAGFNPATASAMPQDTTLQNAISSAWHS